MGKKRIGTKTDLKVCVIGDEDTVTGMLLGGIGSVDGTGKKNFFIADAPGVKPSDIEAAFLDYTSRSDVSIILITQTIASDIRVTVDDYARSGIAIPAVLEIPTKDVPYDPKKDPIMQRVQMFFGANLDLDALASGA